MLQEPVLRAGFGHSLAPAPESLADFCRDRVRPLLREAGAHVIGRHPGFAANLVACVLDQFPGGGDVLLIELAPEWDARELAPLLALLAESYAHANEFWESRKLVTLNAAIERELEMAQRLQDRLIPRLQSIDGLDLAIGYLPSRWVGGDYADALRMPDGRVLVAIADVCGKGLQAALIASSLHTLVHVLVEVCTSLPELVAHVNAYLCRYLPIDSFVTMVCVGLDPATGELECLNSGHLPPLLVGADGEVRPLQSCANVPLGMAITSPRSEHFTMKPGELLLMYTDGLTEIQNGLSSEVLSEPEDGGLLLGALPTCVDIIRSMSGAKIETICECLSESVRIQLGQAMAADDAAFLLARPQGQPLRELKPSNPTQRPPGVISTPRPR